MLLPTTLVLFLLLQGPASCIDIAQSLATWNNGNFGTVRSPMFIQGGQMILGCSVQLEWTGGGWNQCVWYGPRQQVWAVRQGTVMDVNGTKVDIAFPWIETKQDCGIIIGNYSRQDHQGEWRCEFTSSFLKVSGRIHTDDVVTDGLRLPQNIKPVNYKVSLVPDMDNGLVSLKNNKVSYSFNSTVEILVKVVTNTSKIVIHSEFLSIKSFHIMRVHDKKVLKYTGVEFDFQRTKIVIYMEDELVAGKEYTIHFDNIANNIKPKSSYDRGFYPKPCTVRKEKTCWYTQLEVSHARSLIQCFDEPAFKATFDIKVGHRKNMSVLSNMPLQNSIDMVENENWEWDTFQTSAPMSTYLMAVSITDYIPLKSSLNKPRTTVWSSSKSISAGLGNFSRDISGILIPLYEQTLNSTFALPKIDLVTEYAKYGAMENWGLIIIDPSALMVTFTDELKAAVKQAALVISHEFAHQWFGNLVTPKWWNHAWLNEGFAVYFSYLVLDKVQDFPFKVMDSFVVSETLKILEHDSHQNKHWALSDEPKSRPDNERKFGFLSYSKGASLIKMMEHIITLPALIQGTRSYLSKFAYTNVDEDDLFTELEAAAVSHNTWPQGINKSFGDVMKTWTQQPGYPLVTVKRQCVETCTVTLSQAWYLTSGHAESPQFWDIPITMTTLGEQLDNWEPETPDFWLRDNKTVSVSPIGLGPNTTLVVNLKGTGYYRVNYDGEGWKLIAQTLRNNMSSIHPHSRAKLICDVMDLSRHGHIAEDVKDDVLSYFHKEEEGEVARRAYHKCSFGFRFDHPLLKF